MINPVKTAVIGCGQISDAYLSTMINKFRILDVVGCYDRNPHKAQAQAARYGIKAMSLEDILADSSIEIVVNLTQPTSHYVLIKTLLEAGKHVYTEKVLTVDLGQAGELVQLADEKKLYLGAAPDTFLGSAIQTARYVIESGMLGEVSSCVCTLHRDAEIFSRAFPFTAKPGGGIGFDVGIYAITALLSVLGPVSAVSGVVRTRNPQRKEYALERFGETYEIECETLMAGTLQFASGVAGNILFDAYSIFTAPEQPSLVIHGSLGVMSMADPNQFGGDVRLTLRGNNEPFVMQQTHAFNSEFRGLGVAEMAWSMRLGRRHRANKEMAYHALEVLHRMVQSSQTNTVQTLASSFEQTPPLPRGFHGQTYFDFIEEYCLAE